MASLVDLPDEIILDIVEHLESTRDVYALLRSCKKLGRSVDSSSAWRVFVQARFPLLPVPAKTADVNWKGLAESLTYQARCWDRRSIRFTAMYPPQAHTGRGLDFSAVVDADFDMGSGRELVAWGAGPDIVGRFRQKGFNWHRDTVSWRRLLGDDRGFRPGIDDVQTMNILRPPYLKEPALLAGRASGHLSLVSAAPNRGFGRLLAEFSPSFAHNSVNSASHRAPIQSVVRSVDVLDGNTGNGLVAAATNLGITLYELPRNRTTTQIAPVEIYNTAPHAQGSVWNAKWMGSRDLLAIALRQNRDPLRYLARTPSGWVIEAAAKNARVTRQFGVLSSGPLHANSLQPVTHIPGSKTPILLSSWKDGTCRLQDIRTPSAFDTIFQDNVQPFSELDNLITYGADRFLGGDLQGTAVRVFDFRWPKAYYHTSALPCGADHPFPAVQQDFLPAPADTTDGRARCDHARGLRCRWHALSRDIYYRPNAALMLSPTPPPSHTAVAAVPRVTSLARASALSPAFYIGMTGGVIEANLGPIDEPAVFDRNLGFADYRATGNNHGGGGGYLSVPVAATMMETGDGRRAPDNQRTIALPRVHSRMRETRAGDRRWERRVGPAVRRRHRLDNSFQDVVDYRERTDAERGGRRLPADWWRRQGGE